jgi:hypothetical protein
MKKLLALILFIFVGTTGLRAAIANNESAWFQPTKAAASEAAWKALVNVEAGVDFMGYDADLATWAALTPSANGQSLITSANYASMRGLLDLEAGTDFNAYSANLAALAGLTLAADQLPYATGAGALALTSFTAFARTLLDDADAAAMRTTLGAGVGDMARSTYDSDLNGIFNVATGGTGAGTFTVGGVLLGQGTAPFAATSAGTADQVFRVGSGGGSPAFGTISGGAIGSGTVDEARLDANTVLDNESSTFATGTKQSFHRTDKLGINMGNVTGAVTATYTTNVIRMTLTGNTTFTFSGGTAPTSGSSETYLFWITQDGTGGRTLSIAGTSVTVDSAASTVTARSSLAVPAPACGRAPIARM